MRRTLLLLFALVSTPVSAAGTLFGNDLARQCSSGERDQRLVCEAFVDGFLAGLASEGVACPTPEVSGEAIDTLLTLSQEELGGQEAAVVLRRIIADRYACH